ncbi:MAG: hypothetical protein JJT78_16175 [Leptospira sp.]|nr:hypothetical protein [Leptospira sp.]
MISRINRLFFWVFPLVFNLIPLDSVHSADLDFLSLKNEFKKGNYSFVAAKSKETIEKEEYQPKDERLVLLFVSSSSSLSEMDGLLEKCYQANSNRGSVFYNSIYLFMERGLVVGDHSNVEKWGYRFRQNGQQSSRYAEGLYLYASMFYESNRPKDALFVISLALKESPPAVLQSKLFRLKDFIDLEQKKGITQ